MCSNVIGSGNELGWGLSGGISHLSEFSLSGGISLSGEFSLSGGISLNSSHKVARAPTAKDFIVVDFAPG